MRKLSHWLEELYPAESCDIYRDLAYSHAREGGAVGAEIMRLIDAGDLRALVEFELNYSDPAWSAYAVKQCRQALAFFQKLPDLKIGIDKEEVALQKFLEAEELCKLTNVILKRKRAGLLQWPAHVESVFHTAQRKIANVLGARIPKLSELNLSFGPGATRGTPRSESSIRRKLTETIQCSEDLLPAAAMLLGEMPALVGIHELKDQVCWPGLSVEPIAQTSGRIEFGETADGQLFYDEMVLVEVVVTPARLSFVLKNAKTYRTVCVEAGLNVMFQRALGQVIAKRLAAFGIDIRDQSLNQRRALEGSLTGALATLDLSSASDTIALELVFELLPLAWASLLKTGRSSTVELPSGELLTQEKFSSMGNGYTFPLETLIFWGLAAACCDRDSDVTVYGDDIVVPSDKFEFLSEVLRYAGFVVNTAKSYHTGPFRESCGKDYFRGIDVRPFYPKGWVSGQLLFVLHNFYVRDGDIARAKEVEQLIHPDLRIWGPDGYGDGHLIGDHPRTMKTRYATRGFGGYFFDTFTTKTRRDIRPIASGDAVLPAYTVYQRAAGKRVRDVPPWVRSDNEAVNRFRYASWLQLVKAATREVPECAPLPLPYEKREDCKALTLPGVDGYKKITIYTLTG